MSDTSYMIDKDVLSTCLTKLKELDCLQSFEVEDAARLLLRSIEESDNNSEDHLRKYYLKNSSEWSKTKILISELSGLIGV